ncbi:hypothetical protein C8J56DRAFT_959247 [Mycena floridula]|nr:hypothetical protein C8J56DRAFT_959247 [Mycena floridula]
MVTQADLQKAYEVLGLTEVGMLFFVALRTHPDKNPDNPDATAEFQRVSAAYNLLVKHLSDDEDEEDDYDYEYDDDEEVKLAFHMFFFECFMKGGRVPGGRHGFSFENFRREREVVAETPEEYQARIRRSREEQIAGEERRRQELAARRQRIEKQREKERLEAEERQKAKVEEKKNQAAVKKRKEEQAVRDQLQKSQTLRSAVFASARAGKAEFVKKGVWEDDVDAAGGEVKVGCDEYVKARPADPRETLLHIAAKMVNSDGLTAFHVAVQHGRIEVVTYFFDNYPPKDVDSQRVYETPSSKTLLSLAIESHEPEIVWMINDKALASVQDIDKSWNWITSTQGRQKRSTTS